jgi:hypothetical protein
VPLLETCEDAEQFSVIVQYEGSGIWGIGFEAAGVGYTWWVVGVTSYTGGCGGASASGTFSLNGFTYHWTTTFTVVRNNPNDLKCAQNQN